VTSVTSIDPKQEMQQDQTTLINSNTPKDTNITSVATGSDTQKKKPRTSKNKKARLRKKAKKRKVSTTKSS